MSSLRVPFALVDVFAEAPLSGNPLAVVWEADRLSDQTLRDLAREFNQSETTFLLAPTQSRATWRLRSFTPTGAEVSGAGHNALGAWWLVAAAGLLELPSGGATTHQEIGGSTLPVYIEMQDGAPTAVAVAQAGPVFQLTIDETAELAQALDLAPEDIETKPPVQVVSTGAPHLLVPVRSREAVDSAQPDAPRLRHVLHGVGGQGCYLFCLQPVDSDSAAYARFFNPTVGIWEDPATGSAAGPLGCQLVAHGLAADGSVVRIEQGHAMGRPSRIDVTVADDVVQISGTGVIVAEGHLRL